MAHQHHHAGQDVLEPEVRYLPRPERRRPSRLGLMAGDLAEWLVRLVFKLAVVAVLVVVGLGLLGRACAAIPPPEVPPESTTTTVP